MTTYDLVLTGRRVLTPTGERAAWIGVRDGRIATVADLPTMDGSPVDELPHARQRIDLADDEVLMPGLVDTHVHVNEPGRADWEGFATATLAAAAGGVTTVIDMPLNSRPPTVDVAALAAKRAAATGQCYVDVGFWGGAVPGNLAELRPLHDVGVFGFKCFLVDSGVAEFPPLDEVGVRAVLEEIASFGGRLLVHAEDAGVIDRAIAASGGGRSYRRFLDSRPAEAENAAIERLIALGAETGARIHVVHLSSADAVDALAAARRDGVAITAETCPHYLCLAAEDVPDGATQFKCCPPIRDAANRDRLWKALASGVVDMVVSDHSPCPPQMKNLDTGDFAGAWGGIASLQLGLPIVWTAARLRGHTLADLAEWMAAGPAALAGLSQKGRLVAGADADLCVFAPDEEDVVDSLRLYHRHQVTPYDGMRVRGVVRRTYRRGAEVILGDPRGTMLARAG